MKLQRVTCWHWNAPPPHPRPVRQSHLIAVNSQSLAQEGCQSAGEVVERRNVPWAPLNKKNSPDRNAAMLHWWILLLETWKFTNSPVSDHLSALATACIRRSKRSRGHGLASYLCVLSAVCADKYWRYVGFHNKYFRLTATRVLSLYCGFSVCSALECPGKWCLLK